MLKTIFTSAVCLALLTSATLATAAEPKLNALTDQEKEAGWVLLFDGKSLEHFRGYKKDEASDGWKIVDGAITRVGKAGDLMTREQFDNFELSLEYKICEGGNSGIMYRVLETGGASYHTGPEVQVQDNVKGHDPQKAGWLYQLYPSKVDTTKPAGQWNELKILLSAKKCTHHMNGTKYCEYVIGSDDWNAKVAASKFSKWSGFGKAPKGHICLQDHGNEVAYRNIKIRPID
jgi:hypothetical protein